MKLDFIDISRAYFQAAAIRDVYVELPDEDAEPGMCGKLIKSMYGTRDAAQNWGEEYAKFMVDIGFRRGKSSPCVFWHKGKALRCVVHGDDFTLLGWKKELDWFWSTIKARFECKHRGRLGPEEKDAKSTRILNRIVEWTPDGIAYEGDQRHVEICLKEAGIEENSREVCTPTEKSISDSKNSNNLKIPERVEQELDSSGATKYRGLVARLNYLGQDRSDIQYAVKELSSYMANPIRNWHEQNQAPD